MTTQAEIFDRRFDLRKIKLQRPMSMMTVPTAAEGKMFCLLRIVAGDTVSQKPFVLLRMLQMTVAALDISGMRTAHGEQFIDDLCMADPTVTIDQLTHVAGQGTGIPPDQQQNKQHNQLY